MSKIQTAQLHCHTCYSIQDAIPQLKDYVDAIYDYNQSSTKYEMIGFAATDHGVVFNIADHYRECNEPNFPERKTKAIYGMEIYHCLDVSNNPNGDRYHLVLLAMNDIGLSNIYKIASHAGTNLIEGRQKNFPITDINFLRSHGEGIIALSACIGGIIPQLILKGAPQKAEAISLEFKEIFDEFYFEVQALDMTNQFIVNQNLMAMGKKLDIPLVMTSDSHYIKKTDAKYHDILKDISHQIKFSEPVYMKSPEEMETFCITHHLPINCIAMSGEIANKCNANPKPKDNRYLLPVYPVPSGYTEESYLREISLDALQERLVRNNIQDSVGYIKKMLYELEIICNAGYAGYFLILWDWFKWCRDNDILTGTGRGSAAASIISYVLNITKVDPIKNGFVFERFLNPGRLSFPDIDELKVA